MTKQEILKKVADLSQMLYELSTEVTRSGLSEKDALVAKSITWHSSSMMTDLENYLTD